MRRFTEKMGLGIKNFLGENNLLKIFNIFYFSYTNIKPDIGTYLHIYLFI